MALLLIAKRKERYRERLTVIVKTMTFKAEECNEIEAAVGFWYIQP